MYAKSSIVAFLCLCFVMIKAQNCPIRRSPFYGKMTCSRANLKNSICTFSCKPGFRMQGRTQVKCSEGYWDMAFPTCHWIRQCYIQPVRPSNGRITCTDGRQEGSQCSFRCNSGYEMRGSKSITCMGSEWNEPAPTCTPKRTTCMSKSTTLANGFKGCTGNSIGSSCYYVCKPGFNLIGSRKSTCVETAEGGKWSEPPPRCVVETRVHCQEEIVEPENGHKSCSDSHFLGSQCFFECKVGFKLVGKRTSTCVKRFGEQTARWSSPSPLCLKRKARLNACPQLSTMLPNGYKGCTEGNSLGSKCYHVCKPGFTMVGSSKVTCVQTAVGCEWSDTTPMCIKSGSCPVLAAPQNGRVSCTDGKKRHSRCLFECDVGFDLVGSDSTTCEKRSQSESWDSPPPMCIKSLGACEASKRSDVVIVLDSSLSFGTQNWREAKEFARKFINSFVMSGDSTRFSVIQYNGAVQVESQILLGDYLDDKRSFMDAFNRLPSELGFGLSTGKALTYVKDVVLKEENGDRPDVRNIVVLFTAAKSNDDVSFPAQQLREETGDTTIYVVGINPVEGRVDTKELRSITGSVQQFFFAEEGFFGVDKAISKHLDDSVCRIQSED